MSFCKECSAKRHRERNFAKSPEVLRKRNLRLKDERANPDNRAKFITRDSRQGDKRKGFDNDLTIDAVKEMIALGCHYCGNTSIKMTIDRRHNHLGHTLDNVQPACIRCNMIRGNMPYAAWEAIVPSIKATFEAGLFEDWTGAIHN